MVVKSPTVNLTVPWINSSGTPIAANTCDGFKDFESFTKGKVKKEVRKGLRELEHTLNNTSRDNNGNLQMVSSVNSDPNSYLGKGIKLDF